MPLERLVLAPSDARGARRSLRIWWPGLPRSGRSPRCRCNVGDAGVELELLTERQARRWALYNCARPDQALFEAEPHVGVTRVNLEGMRSHRTACLFEIGKHFSVMS